MSNSIVVGVWIAKGTKHERRERDFVIFAGFRGFRDPKAHEATAAGDTAQVREIEAEIDRLVAGLWGLSYGCHLCSEKM